MATKRPCHFCDKPCDGSFCAYCDRSQEVAKGIPTIKDIRRVVREEIAAVKDCLTIREATLLRGVVMDLRVGDAGCTADEIQALCVKLDQAKRF